MKEVSLTINETELKKITDGMLRQRCTSGDEHQYHIDQMKNFLKSDIVWESRKEILASPHPQKTTPLVQSCQRDPEAPALSLINQDLLYLKKGNSGPKKIVLSLHKFPAIIFNNVDIEERTSRWVNKCVKKFNPYARYGVEHWKNPHAKIFYIKRQKEPGKPKEVFTTEIVARRANECIVSITKSDYKNLNKNDIEDIYLLIMNGKDQNGKLIYNSITYEWVLMSTMMALELMDKAFTLNDTTPTNNNQSSSSNPSSMQIAQLGMNMDQDRQMLMVEDNVGNQVVLNASQNPGVQNVGNQNGLSVVSEIANQHGDGNVVTAPAEGNGNGINGNTIRCYNCQGEDHYASNCTVKPRKLDAAYLQKQMQIAQKEEAGIQLTSEEFDFMAAAGACEETERANANCTLENNLQLASTSGTQSDKAPVYDSDGSAEVHHSENCYNNDIFNMFTQEEQYTELLEPIPEPHQVQQNDSNVISVVSSVEQSGGTVEQHPANIEETRAYFESLYNNLATEVEKVNLVNRKMKETNAELTTELARYKNQEKCFEISQEKYDKLERCYQKSVYQEQCLTKKINALHLSSGKQITTLNEEISNLSKQLSTEKSTVSSLLEEKKKLKSDFKIREDELLDKQIQLENKIKELDNILVKTGQSIQTMHMLSPKPDSFYHTEQKMALGYQNPFYLKQAQRKQQSLYNGKVLFEKHDPPAVHDSEETLQLAQESRLKMKQLNKEIKLLQVLHENF
ncbi:retrovirus-related pol polyprotein from transposon TNT 1-94 [Tanacetum coccineum]